MDAEIQRKLREKFETTQIGLKPKITCKACTDSRGKACDKHPKAKCTSLRGEPGCGQWVTPAHMHIEFVGHANVTDREVVDRHRTTGVRHDSDDLSKAVRRDGPSNRS